MIRFTVDPNDGPKIAAHLEQVRVRILTAIRGGMREAMQDLAQYIVGSKLSGSPIAQRKGNLAAAVLASARVTGNEEVIRGSVAAKPRVNSNEGIWQEFGTNHPALEGKLRVFIGRDGTPVFTHHLKAFTIAPKPFLNPSLHEQETKIVETIRARLREADLR